MLALATMLVGSIVFFCAGADVSSQFQPSSTQEWVRLQASWQSQQPVAYYVLANDLINEISTNTVLEEVNGKTAKLLEHVLSKGIAPKEGVIVEDLDAVEKLSLLLMSALDASSEEERRTNAVLLATCLRSIKEAHVEGYEPKKVYMNIFPPYTSPGYGLPVMAGMNPDVITNSVMKAKYKEAMRRNSKNNDENTRQEMIENLQRPLRRRLIIYMELSVMKGSLTPDIIKTCAEVAGVSEAEIRNGSANYW